MDRLEKRHAAEWKRCIITAGADENVAQQAVALAALNGLFDIYKRGADVWPVTVEPCAETVKYDVNEPVMSETVKPHPGVRWIIRGDEKVLQQRYEAVTYTKHSPTSLKYVWRDVLVEPFGDYPPGDDPRQEG